MQLATTTQRVTFNDHNVSVLDAIETKIAENYRNELLSQNNLTSV